jgi:ABC-2 type transport system ATP-binding protein
MKNPDRHIQSNLSEDTAIQTMGLSRKFGQLTAVDRIDLRVKRGQIFGLLGPNGAETIA